MAKRAFVVGIALFVCGVAGIAGAWDFAGEHMVYEFGWQNISAATVEINIKKIDIDGQPGFHTDLFIKGQPKLDWIWRVRDHIFARNFAGTLLPDHYFFQQREASFHLDTEIKFDAEKQTLFGTRTRIKKGKKKSLTPKQAPAGYHDPVGALMVLRRVSWAPGKSHTLKIFDGKRKHTARYTVIGEQKVEIPLGTFDTWKIQPQIIESSSKDKKAKAEKVREVYVYLDKKPPHHVVRVETEAFWGFIYAELVEK